MISLLLNRVNRRISLVTTYKTAFLRQYVRGGFKVKTIVTYPERPHPTSLLYKMSHLMGYRLARRAKKADLFVHWEDRTERRSVPWLLEIDKSQPVLNLRCRDISKRKVEEVHQAVFGYNLTIDPLTYQEKCVRKSNLNAVHDGQVVQCPLQTLEGDFLYQKIINNQIDAETVQDIRVPVFGDVIPFCYLKMRPLKDRFSNQNTFATLVERDTVLSCEEAARILQFCRGMGLDYGELDVLRNAEDGKIYVVDVNNTPCGPPNHLEEHSREVALRRLSDAFAASFLS